MFRICLFVCVSLISGIAAKPWDKLTGEAFQDTVLSIDGEGKMSVGVEPPEDMDETHYDIDPSMQIWQSMTGGGQEKHFQKAEDLDHLYHPSMEDLQAQIINLDAVPAAELWKEAEKEGIYYPAEEPEQDWNEAYNEAREQLDRYLAPLVAKNRDGVEVRGAVYEPEEDKDDLYHGDAPSWSVEMEQLKEEARSESEVRIHEVPEEDMDDLYHRDFLLPVAYRDYVNAAAPLYLPSEKEYREPEEDLDDLYHP
ncbi:uncharacterized protein si:ch211-217g15.3 [Acanthochromis polyacanthus]|uniref:uncharacterized protein si:ch211-217g15.3 n=1 Tax=Acanthochromis polyacanthus TaxID=80966 RepID=UPI0022341D31|nr:uncharacterized protein si:ch211-217g15.3 [Acanthochromis polyacanthus]